MASRSVLRYIKTHVSTLLKNNHRCVAIPNNQLNQTILNFQIVRHAGHAKWQNIAADKKISDRRRSNNTQMMINKAKAAIKLGGGTNPESNLHLASVLEEARQKEVLKAVTEFVKSRDNKGAMKEMQVVFRGPDNTIVIVNGTTDKPLSFREEVMAIAKKRLLGFLEDKTLASINYAFEEKAEVRVLANDEECEALSLEQAEELAIECEAEEVETASSEDLGEFYRFITSKEDMFKVKKALEEKGIKVADYSCGLQPIAYGELNESQLQTLRTFMEQVTKVNDLDDVITNLKDFS